MKWSQQHGMMDGLTTNGVLIMHPQSGEHGVLSNHPRIWREVSIAADVYCLRRARSDRGVGKKVSKSVADPGFAKRGDQTKVLRWLR